MTKPVRALLIVVAALVLLLVMRSLWSFLQPTESILQGHIEAREFIVSSKVPGRIGSVLVEKGQIVAVDDLIFTIVSPELDAKMQQAEAGRDAVGALARQAEVGAREQEIAIAREQWEKSKVAEELFHNTYLRIQSLYESGVVALQLRDEAHAQWQAAKLTATSAAAFYDMVQEGTREEIVDAARAELSMADAAVAEVSAFQADTRIFSWMTGEVSEIIMRPGEIVPPGFPVVTLIDMSQAYAVVAVREDQLPQFVSGAKVSADIPALGLTQQEFTVRHVAVMGDYATWRATDSRQGYDMRTFEVELEPVEELDNLRAGMSVLVYLSAAVNP